MKKTFYILICLLFLKTVFGQASKKFVGTFIFDDKIDSVNLTISKNRSFKTIEISMCSGDDTLYSNGKWKAIGDTLILTTDSRSKTGQAKPKTYEWKPQSAYLMRNDTLFLLDDKKQIKPKRFYCRVWQVDRSIKAIVGTYHTEKSERYTRSITIKNNGEVKKTFHNLTSGFKETETGQWKTNGDTLIITFKGCWVDTATTKYLIGNKCLLDKSLQCVYFRKKP